MRSARVLWASPPTWTCRTAHPLPTQHDTSNATQPINQAVCAPELALRHRAVRLLKLLLQHRHRVGLRWCRGQRGAAQLRPASKGSEQQGSCSTAAERPAGLFTSLSPAGPGIWHSPQSILHSEALGMPPITSPPHQRRRRGLLLSRLAVPAAVQRRCQRGQAQQRRQHRLRSRLVGWGLGWHSR